eukprot:1477213-Alexandrium_andersonii.AAC.1
MGPGSWVLLGAASLCRLVLWPEKRRLASRASSRPEHPVARSFASVGLAMCLAALAAPYSHARETFWSLVGS